MAALTADEILAAALVVAEANKQAAGLGGDQRVLDQMVCRFVKKIEALSIPITAPQS